jgi:hypothetical protein
MRETMKRKLIWIAPLAIVGLLLFVGLGGEVVRLLWNWLMPSLFGLRQVTFWEALGLLALCRILFGGLGGCHQRSGVGRRLAGRWERMTPEERERFRQHLREHWGHGPTPDAPAGQ